MRPDRQRNGRDDRGVRTAVTRIPTRLRSTHNRTLTSELPDDRRIRPDAGRFRYGRADSRIRLRDNT